MKTGIGQNPKLLPTILVKIPMCGAWPSSSSSSLREKKRFLAHTRICCWVFRFYNWDSWFSDPNSGYNGPDSKWPICKRNLGRSFVSDIWPCICWIWGSKCIIFFLSFCHQLKGLKHRLLASGSMSLTYSLCVCILFKRIIIKCLVDVV